MLEPLEIRPEEPDDAPSIRAVNTAAFGRPEEARLVDALREAGALPLSLVAVYSGEIIGHIAFSRVELGESTCRNSALALAPMAVHPQFQRQSVGSRLVEVGLGHAAAWGADLVIVLGHPSFYPRFGFVPAGPLGIQCPCKAPSEAFMVREITPNAVATHQGIVSYHAAFNSIA